MTTPEQIELSLINEDRFFSSYVKWCREHGHDKNNLRTLPRLERRCASDVCGRKFRVFCPVCKRATEWINTQRAAIATWNMIIALTSKKV